MANIVNYITYLYVEKYTCEKIYFMENSLGELDFPSFELKCWEGMMGKSNEVLVGLLM